MRRSMARSKRKSQKEGERLKVPTRIILMKSLVRRAQKMIPTDQIHQRDHFRLSSDSSMIPKTPSRRSSQTAREPNSCPKCHSHGARRRRSSNPSTPSSGKRKRRFSRRSMPPMLRNGESPREERRREGTPSQKESTDSDWPRDFYDSLNFLVFCVFCIYQHLSFFLKL